MAQKNPKNKGQHNNPFEVDGGEEPNEKAGATRPSTPFIVIGVGIATLFAIGGVVVGAIYIAKRHNREVQEVSQPKLPNTVPEVPDEIPDPLIAISKSDDAGSPLSGEEVFKRLMKSTAFIVPIHENKDFVSCGSGVLVHSQRRLVMTNFHVVKNSDTATVYFPLYERNGELIARPKDYIDNSKGRGHRGKVVFRDVKKDLALLELADLPTGVVPISLASKPAATGSKLYSVGASGVELRDFSGTLWRLSTGETRGRNDQKLFAGGRTTDAMILESQKPINPGDSGGPTVNEHGSLAGLVCMYDPSRAAVALDIDLIEIEKFFARYAQEDGHAHARDKMEERKRKLEEERRARAKATIENAIIQLSDSSATVRREGLSTITTHGASGRHVIPKVLDLTDDPDAEVQRSAEVTLGKIGPPGKEEIQAFDMALAGKGTNARRIALIYFLGADAPTLNPKSILSVTRLLDSTSESEQLYAIKLLSKHGRNCKTGALPGLIKLAGSDTDAIRQMAHNTIDAWAPYDSNDVSAWIAALESPSSRLRLAAVSTLAKFAGDAKRAIDWFSPRLKDESSVVVVAALRSISQWSHEAIAAVKDVEALTISNKDPVVIAALQALSKILPARELPVVLARLRINEPKSESVCNAYLTASLAAKYPDEHRTLDALKPLLKGTSTVIRAEALRQLIELGAKAEPVLAEVAACLDETDDGVRAYALDVMASIGPASASKASLVLKVVNGKPGDKVLGAKAIRTLIAMGSTAADSLAKAYRITKDEQLASLILATMTNYGVKANEAVPELLASAEDRTHPHSALYIALLGQLERGKEDYHDPISTALAKIGGDKLAGKLIEMTNPEIKNAFGQDTKYLSSKLGGKPIWALQMLGVMDPASVSSDQRTLVYKRLIDLEGYDLSRSCRKSSKAALENWKIKPK